MAVTAVVAAYAFATQKYCCVKGLEGVLCMSERGSVHHWEDGKLCLVWIDTLRDLDGGTSRFIRATFEVFIFRKNLPISFFAENISSRSNVAHGAEGYGCIAL
ncbi:hypothetical protein FRX31_034027 [Thalictrum thalictroides]|uniref:Uncharacterized protein n=1 Tax=Thalictrum thalictroides TaxID=46969 RepID=A0A7J6UUX9_THATH|nr:hypothetical protein FRX31_034027 [Thalictrum thalictroides]